MADTKVSALSEISVPDLEDLLYLVDDPSGTPVSNKATVRRLLGQMLPGQIGGRLTTETGVAVSTSDRTAQGTLYYTPFLHSRISLYDATRWRLYSFTERSLSLTLTSGKNYDVFLYDNAGTLTLELSAAWTNDTTRADALTTQDSIQVKSGATTRRWLGTIRASGTNVTEDSGGGATTQVGGKRFVYNAFNQVHKWMSVIDTADSWSYTTNTWRVSNGATAPTNCLEYIDGRGSGLVDVTHIRSKSGTNTSNGAKIGVGIDSGSTPSGLRPLAYDNTNQLIFIAMTARYQGFPGLGYHYLAPLEKGGDNTCTFYGDNGNDGSQAGMTAWVDC